jgi:hypothetical protein
MRKPPVTLPSYFVMRRMAGAELAISFEYA